MKRSFLFLIALLAALLVRAGDRPPNILFICVDDLQPLLGCYNKPSMQTPNIDRLASEGMLFERAYCQFAICGPSRASVLSGMYPQNNGIRDNSIGFRKALPDAWTLPQYFRKNGYNVVGMGKIFHELAAVDPASWSRWVDIKARGCFLPENIADNIKRQADIAAREAAGEKFTPHQKYVYTVGPFSEAAEVDERLYPDGELASRAVEILREQKNASEPLFLAVGFLKPHLPFVVPKKYWDLYDPESFTLPENRVFPSGAPAYHTHDSFEMRSYSDVPKKGPLGESILRRAMHGYYAACSFVDAQIGLVLSELERQGLKENTVVVLWGDNGFHLGEQNIIGKDTNYETSARCPLIIRVPGTGIGRTDRLVELVDIFPTLCELAGLPVPPQCEGRNLFSKAADAAAFTMNQRKWNNPNVGYAMRTDRYRYIRWLDASGAVVAEELYDYQLDFIETRNLLLDLEYKPVLVALREQFDREDPIHRKRGGGDSSKESGK